MDYKKYMELNEAIVNDAYLKLLFKQKQRVLNSILPKYLMDKKTNTITHVLDEWVVKALEKIDSSMNFRIDQIKNHFEGNGSVNSQRKVFDDDDIAEDHLDKLQDWIKKNFNPVPPIHPPQNL